MFEKWKESRSGWGAGGEAEEGDSGRPQGTCWAELRGVGPTQSGKGTRFGGLSPCMSCAGQKMAFSRGESEA